MMKVKVILTCFNRKEKTIRCIKGLLNNVAELSFIVVDDNSSDGTAEALKKLDFNMTIIYGNGNLFWAGGMRVGIKMVLHESTDIDYVLLVNDDVVFYDDVIDKMIAESISRKNSVIVGTCCDTEGKTTYGAIKFHGIFSKSMYYHLSIEKVEQEADTFNCNAVLLPIETVKKVGNFDPVYTHNFADYDYGFMLKKKGFHIYGTPFYVGECSDDTPILSWENRSLSRKKRIQLKESPKGLPQREWNHFLLKNLGVIYFLRYGYTAKIKIGLGL